MILWSSGFERNIFKAKKPKCREGLKNASDEETSRKAKCYAFCDGTLKTEYKNKYLKSINRS